MRINTNINSMRTQEYMRQNQAKMSNAMDRLSSGKRINNASDDAAGLAIATRMRARESGLSVAADNTQNGMSLIRTADSAMNSVSNILLRMRDIANQSANGTNTDKNQVALQKEFAALKEQITYIADNTQFNDKNLLNGDQTINIQTLDSHDSTKQIGIDLKSATLNALGIKDLTVGATGSSLAADYLKAKDNLAANSTLKDLDIAKAAVQKDTVAKTFVDAKVAMNVNAVAKAFGNAASNVQDLATDYLSEKNTFDTTASSAQKALITNYEAKVAAGEDASTEKGLVDADPVAKAYNDAKEAMEANDVAKNFVNADAATQKLATDYIAAKTELDKGANLASQTLVNNLDTAQLAVTTDTGGTIKALTDKLDAAKTAMEENKDAKELIANYESKKAAMEGNATVKAYLDAKKAVDEDKTNNADLKTKMEEAKAKLDKDDIATGLVKAFDAAKEAVSPVDAKPLDAVKQIDAALKTVADNRATLGATLNRLDFNVNNLKSQSSAMAASASQIEDADMAKEMSEMTKFKILNEAGISMLSQANQTPQMVSKLLQ
ncbi:flagellin [Bacillus paranthracis]|uniref:flagellin N-terminal helical domain-containing protein n=1 Tax=Bacillus paranthracis TaxID=2026186 RepID=UPI00132E7BAD|nr:flagellin [Bacillus paranthracis]